MDTQVEMSVLPKMTMLRAGKTSPRTGSLTCRVKHLLRKAKWKSSEDASTGHGKKSRTMSYLEQNCRMQGL